MRKILLVLIISLFVYGQNGCESRLFTINSKPGVKVKEFIDNLAEECGLTVIYEDRYARRKLYESVDRIHLKDVPLYELLNILLSSHDLDWELDKNILKIRYLITKTFHIDYITSIRKGEATTDASVDIGATSQEGGAQRQTRDVNLITSLDEFDFWKNLQAEIYNILNRPGDNYKAPKPVINENAGLVTVTATKKQIARVKKYIDLIENRLHKEVMIDVSILAVLFKNSFTSGIDWSRFSLTLNGTLNSEDKFTPTNPIATYQDVAVGSNFKNLSHATTATTIINAAFNLSGLIDFLQKNGKVITLSNPKLLTLNNQPAIITIGETLNYNVPTSITISANSNLGEKSYTPSSIFVGILLNITPEITRDNNIILRINPSISELRNPEEAEKSNEAGFREIAPDTKEKKISSVVKVKDGSTLILGGLISNSKNFLINGVPVLKDIPVIGNIFKSKKRDNQRFELIFVIKPKIVDERNNYSLSLKDLGFKDINKDIK